MKNKILKTIFLISISIIAIKDIDAIELNNNKYKIEIANNNVEQEMFNGTQNFYLKSSINTETSNLSQGKIDVDLIFDNNRKNEIIYIIDNISDFPDKSNIISELQLTSDRLKKLDNVLQGLVVTTSNSTYESVSLTNKSIESELEKINTMSTSNEGDIFNALDHANKMFTKDPYINNILVIIVNSLGKEEIDLLNSKIAELSSKGVHILAYKTNSKINSDDFYNIFNHTNSHPITKKNFQYWGFYSNLYNHSTFNMMFSYCEITFNEDILNNFSIENIKFDNSSKEFNISEIIFPIELNNNNKIYLTDYKLLGDENYQKNPISPLTLTRGNQIKISYTLNLKEEFDEQILNKILEINDDVSISFSINFYDYDNFEYYSLYNNDIDTHSDKIIDKSVSSGVSFKITKEEEINNEEIEEPEVENPKTGMPNYIIFGLCLVIISITGYWILNKRKKMNL